jgi:hypothetical protein
VQNYNDGGVDVPFRIGAQGELICSDINGFFAEQTMRGNSYIYATTTAVNIPIFSTPTNAPTLWNPAGSGKILILNSLTLSISAIGTPALDGIMLIGTALNIPAATTGGGSAGATAATGANSPVLTAVFVAAQNALLGSSKRSVMQWCPATITFGASNLPSQVGFAPFNLSAAATPAYAPFFWDIQGRICLMPGSLIALGGTPAATSTTFQVQWTGVEIPLPAFVS